MKFITTFILLAIAACATPALSLPMAGSQELAARDNIQTRDELFVAARDEVDDILDEIDAVLEGNTEEFVKDFVQKGGQ
jgi:ubiquitin-like protein Pup